MPRVVASLCLSLCGEKAVIFWCGTCGKGSMHMYPDFAMGIMLDFVDVNVITFRTLVVQCMVF